MQGGAVPGLSFEPAGFPHDCSSNRNGMSWGEGAVSATCSHGATGARVVWRTTAGQAKATATLGA